MSNTTNIKTELFLVFNKTEQTIFNRSQILERLPEWDNFDLFKDLLFKHIESNKKMTINSKNNNSNNNNSQGLKTNKNSFKDQGSFSNNNMYDDFVDETMLSEAELIEKQKRELEQLERDENNKKILLEKKKKDEIAKKLEQEEKEKKEDS